MRGGKVLKKDYSDMFLMRAFTCSLQVVCYIFVVFELWKILVVVQPLCLSLGNVDASVTNTIPADPLLTLDESHWLELMDPGDAVPVAFWLPVPPWSTCHGGQDGNYSSAQSMGWV